LYLNKGKQFCTFNDERNKIQIVQVGFNAQAIAKETRLGLLVKAGFF